MSEVLHHQEGSADISTHTPRARADSSPARHIGLILRPLYSRIIGIRAAAKRPASEAAPSAAVAADRPDAIDHDYCERLMAELRHGDTAPARGPDPSAETFEEINPAALLAEVDHTARTEPDTVAEARDMIADPAAALRVPQLHRQVAWLVAAADLRHRRATGARTGGTAA